jgi:hypothetical protein
MLQSHGSQRNGAYLIDCPNQAGLSEAFVSDYLASGSRLGSRVPEVGSARGDSCTGMAACHTSRCKESGADHSHSRTRWVAVQEMVALAAGNPPSFQGERISATRGGRWEAPAQVTAAPTPEELDNPSGR